MICYKDKTFCVANCATTTCPVMYTEQVQLDSDKWWNKGIGKAPIMVSDYSDTCKDYKEKK